jgi:hypothetical protein
MKPASMVLGSAAMANPSSGRPDASNVDESPRPPTFVQIHARPTTTIRKMLVTVGVGIALVTALGWAAYRVTVELVVPVVMQVAPTVAESLPPQPSPADLYSELTRLTIVAAISALVWSRESLTDQILPFDASVSDRQLLSGAPTAYTRAATQAGSYEVPIASGRGIRSKARCESSASRGGYRDAVSALAPTSD